MRSAYRTFLSATGGKDVWEGNMTTSVGTDWTCVGHSSHTAYKILDRAVIPPSVICSSIQTLPSVPLTNHRPILLKLRTGLYTGFSTTRGRPQATRLRKPPKATADARFEAMNSHIANYMGANPPPTLTLHDPPSCADSLLAYCESVFIPACNRAFEKPRPQRAPLTQRDKRNAATDAIGKRITTIGKLKQAVTHNTLQALLSTCPSSRHELREIEPVYLRHPPADDVLLHSMLNADRYSPDQPTRSQRQRSNKSSVAAA